MLSSKIAFITGAGGGIGKATALLFAKEGAKVIAADVNGNSVSSTVSLLTGDGHLNLTIDVSKSGSVNQSFDTILSKYGVPPNIVVNAAGIIKDNFILNITEDDFDKVIDVNLKGTFLVTQKFCQLLINEKLTGSIVNVSSVVGRRGNKGQCNYAASKAGVETFSKCVALEMAKYKIRCNSVIPGFISTNMTAGIPDKVKELFKSLIPLQQFGKPEEVAEVIGFLASDKSSYVTGTSVYVTGGFE